MTVKVAQATIEKFEAFFKIYEEPRGFKLRMVVGNQSLQIGGEFNLREEAESERRQVAIMLGRMIDEILNEP